MIVMICACVGLYDQLAAVKISIAYRIKKDQLNEIQKGKSGDKSDRLLTHRWMEQCIVRLLCVYCSPPQVR